MPTYFEKYAAGQRRFWYISGLTSDEFYSASCMQLDLDVMLWQELRDAGYEKIIFYNKTKRLYCYDEHSYAFLIGKEPEDAPQQLKAPRPARQKGLKKRRMGQEISPLSCCGCGTEGISRRESPLRPRRKIRRSNDTARHLQTPCRES